MGPSLAAISSGPTIRKTGSVDHLSSFGTTRAGTGSGEIDKEGNVLLKLVFSDEAEGTYRMYNYRWTNSDEYHMKSVQFGSDDRLHRFFL